MKIRQKLFGVIALSLMFTLCLTLKSYAFNFHDSADNLVGIDLQLEERANIDGDAILLGETVNYAGHVGGNIVSGGNNVSISCDDFRNGFIMAKGNVDIKSNAQALYIFASNVTVKGNCKAAYLVGQQVTIDGIVDGDLRIIASSIKFGENAKVNGTLRIESPIEPEYPEGIAAESVTFKRVEETEKEEMSLTDKLLRLSSFLIWLAPTGLITSMIYIKLLGPTKRKGVDELKKRPVKVFLYGLLMLVGMPTISVLFMVAIVGIPTSMIILMIYMIIFLLAVPCFGVAIGELIFPEQSDMVSGLIGTLINSILVAVPYLGALVYFVSVVYTYGIFTVLIAHSAKEDAQNENRKPSKVITKVKEKTSQIKDKLIKNSDSSESDKKDEK